MDSFTWYDSPVGRLLLLSDGEALLGLWMEGQTHFGCQRLAEAIQDDTLPLFSQVRRWLDDYFLGGHPTPPPQPLSPVGTAFQQQVWQALLTVPYGETRTYGNIARQIGKPRAFQAVGSAVGRNPVSIIIPCHRIVGSQGQLTGYAGGLDRKQWLLRHEAETKEGIL
ncbi:MAG: methylated-DNA--[Oscillospiraceae bacterium]|nr:methylated-DNA--[protein]-cysteine S-methyltransferase [Oscillospiraceae bacterium]